MERTGSSRQVQGGGDGIGFRPPTQMMRTSPESILKISRESMVRANLKLDEEKKVMEATGNVDEMRKQKMKTWVDVLSSRYFMLRRRHELLRSSSERNMAAGASGILGHSPSTVEADAPFQSSSTEGAVALPQPQSTFEAANTSIRRESIPVSTRVADLSQAVQKRWVPGIPKTIEKAVHLWRMGDSLSSQVALRKFSTAEKRKEVIGLRVYSDKLWENTGNKRRFLRLKALINLVVEGSSIQSVEEEGRDAEWKDAILKFHDKWDVDGKPRSLSSILKHK